MKEKINKKINDIVDKKISFSELPNAMKIRFRTDTLVLAALILATVVFAIFLRSPSFLIVTACVFVISVYLLLCRWLSFVRREYVSIEGTVQKKGKESKIPGDSRFIITVKTKNEVFYELHLKKNQVKDFFVGSKYIFYLPKYTSIQKNEGEKIDFHSLICYEMILPDD